MPMDAMIGARNLSATRPATGEKTVCRKAPGHEYDAGDLGVQPPVVLQVEAEQEGHGEGGRVVDERSQVGESEDGVVAQQAHAQDRVGGHVLQQEEHHQSDHARRHEDDAGQRRQVRQAHQERAQRHDPDARAQVVEAGGPRLAPLHAAQLPERHQRVDEGGGADDDEEAPPTGVVTDDPAQHRAERRAKVDAGDLQPDGPSPRLRRIAEYDEHRRGAEQQRRRGTLQQT